MTHGFFYDRCLNCSKWSYPSRKTARKWARQCHPSDSRLQAYECPHQEGKWHYGHRKDQA